MRMIQGGVTVGILPDGAYCSADEARQSPLDMDECPLGKEECEGDCFYYSE